MALGLNESVCVTYREVVVTAKVPRTSCQRALAESSLITSFVVQTGPQISVVAECRPDTTLVTVPMVAVPTGGEGVREGWLRERAKDDGRCQSKKQGDAHRRAS